MAFVVNDRVKETTTSTGTGTINLAGAETGFETFVAGIGNSNTTYYCIQAQGGSAFEIGVGTVTDASPDTLSRTTIISSSNSDSAVDFGVGTKDVFCTLPASKAVIEDNSTNADIAGNLTVGGTVDGVDIAARDAVLTSTTTTATNANTTANAALPKAGGTMTGDLILGDNVQIELGDATGGDLQIFHNGVDSVIKDAGTGSLEIRATDLKLNTSDNSQNMIKAIDGGAVELYHNGTKMIETTADGLGIPDNKKLEIGDGQDLKLYHDTSDSYISEEGTGKLIIRGSTAVRITNVGGDNMFVGNDGGAAEMYHAGTKKLETTSSGFAGSGDTFTLSTGGTEFGRIENDSNDMYIRSMVQDKDIQFRGNDGGSEITALTLDMSAAGALVVGSDVKLPDNGKVIFGAGSDFQIYHNGAQTIMDDSGTGSLELRSNAFTVATAGGSASMATFTEGGSVVLFHNGSSKFSTNANGVQVAADQRIEIVNGSNWSGELVGKIEHHSSNMYHQYNSNWIARNGSGTNTLNIDSSGNGTFNGNVTAYSDIRLKEDVKTIDNALDKVCKLRGVEYTRKQTGVREIGVIANEVKEVVPELVTVTDLRSDINPDELNDVHVMKYQNTVGLLIEAIKDLKAEIEELKKAK